MTLSSGGITSGGRSGDGGGSVYTGGVYKSSGYNGFKSSRNTNYMGSNNQNNINPKTLEQQKSDSRRSTGMSVSAWGIISITLFIILLGAVAYYGSMCYPLVCRNEQNYDIMNISTGSQTPTKSADQFEKLGNYSSRSTTPSKSNEFTEI